MCGIPIKVQGITLTVVDAELLTAFHDLASGEGACFGLTIQRCRNDSSRRCAEGILSVSPNEESEHIRLTWMFARDYGNEDLAILRAKENCVMLPIASHVGHHA